MRWAVRVQQSFEVGSVEGREAVSYLPLHVHVLCLLWGETSRQLALQSIDLCIYELPLLAYVLYINDIKGPGYTCQLSLVPGLGCHRLSVHDVENEE